MPDAPRRAAAAGATTPRWAWTTWWSARRSSGPTSTLATPPRDERRSSSTSELSSPGATREQDTDVLGRSRRAAYASAPADAASSHCTSSTRRAGPVAASARERVQQRDANSVRVRRRPSSSSRTSARDERRSLPAGRGERLVEHGVEQVAEAGEAERVSLSAGSACSTQSPRPPHPRPRTPERRLPHPASPSSTSADAPSEIRRRSRGGTRAPRPGRRRRRMSRRSYADRTKPVRDTPRWRYTIFQEAGRSSGSPAARRQRPRSPGSRTR